MIWFQCDDCGDCVKKSQLPRHFRFCSATKFSCVECGNMFEQDSVQYHEQCITGAELSKRSSWFCSLCNVNSTCERDFFKHVNGRKHRAEELDLADKQKRQAGQPTVDKENSKQQPNFDITVGLSNCDPWFCSLCNSKSTSQQSLLDHAYGRKHRANVEEFNANQQQRQSESFIVDKKDNSKQQTEVDINVGLSNCYPWFCSLCNTNSTSQQDHANGRKHRENVEEFDANRQQRQSEPSIVDKKNNSKQQTEVDINVGLSNCYPWFCSVCNIKATCKQNLLAHANGWKHRENIKYFAVEQQQYSEQSTVEKKDTIENASNGNSEQKKVASPVPSGVGNEYSLVDKKRKLQTFDETWKGEVIQAEEAKGGSERSRESKKAKKQSELDSDFENDREDIKLLLVSYSKEELVNLVYKTAEEGSRLISAILESADLDINQRNIFVRGFGWDITQGNLKVAFESYGEIEDCSVIMDKITGRGKGYGFVLFKTWKGARMALKNPQKRMFNRMVECNLASAKPCRAEKPHDLVEPVKIDLTSSANQSEVVLPRLELAHGHVLDRREQQQTMEMFGQNMPFYGHSQLPGFDPMYGALRGSQMFSGPPSSSMFGPSMMNQGSMLPPPTHMDMAGQYFGDGEQALVRAQALTPSPFHVANPESAVVIFNPSLVQESMPPPTNVAASSPQVDGVTVLQGPKLVSSTPGVAAVSGGVDPSHSLSTKEDKDDVTVCSPRRVSRASSPFLGDFEERGEAFVPFHSQNQVQEGQSSVNPVIDLTEDLPESKRVVRCSGMRKRKDKSDLSAPPAKVSRPSRSSSRSTRSDYDSSLFSSFEAMERYRFYSADPRIHKEQVKYFSSSEENIRNLIARASLLSTVDSVVEYDLDVLLEFWSNLPPIKPGEHSVNVFVRGHLYEFSVARINSLFGLPDVDDRDGNAEMARVYPADLAVIVTGGKKTVWDKGISPSFIEPYTSLYPICCSNWDPTTNTLYVKLGRVQLMYKLVHKIPFNFGKSVFDQILRIAHTPQSNLYLPFPSLITRLLTTQRPVPPRPIQSSTHRTTPRQGNVTSDASPGSNDHLRRVLAAVITMCQDALRAGGEGDEHKFFDDQADQDLSD